MSQKPNPLAKAMAKELSPKPTVKATPSRKAKATAPKKASRVNTAMIGGHFPREVSQQLRILAAEEDTTQQQLLEEALNLLFVKKGKKKIGV